MSLRCALCLGIFCVTGGMVQADHRLVVHEWGTFTALQNEEGNAVGGINTDDEPVPRFVHTVSDRLLIPKNEAPPSFFQGAPSCHPDVTMRLETPVIYFHPANNFRGLIDIKVEFRGGWLTQYFPDAVVTAPGITQNKFSALTDETTGSLAWNRLQLGAKTPPPVTDDHVWVTPRQVDAAAVATEGGESEKFVFYRGVAHCTAPLRVVRRGNEFVISENSTEHGQLSAADIRDLWLAEIRADGTAAFRLLHPFEQGPAFLIRTGTAFAASDFSTEAPQRLKLALRATLVEAGLVGDEAEALLNTWELSYFRSPGMRLFFLVPKNWTEKTLPLTISPSADVTRVMVGRIEIVTPEQRALLAKIAAGPAPESWKGFRDELEAATIRAGRDKDWNDVMDGKKTFASIGFTVPELYRDYLNLGRFRNALLLDEQARRPTNQLADFIKNFRLEGYKY